MTTIEIWHILNEACHGKMPVYELACACKGLQREVIMELADKIEKDMHATGFNDWEYKKFLDKAHYKQRTIMGRILKG